MAINSLRLLLVEDNPADVRLICEALRANNIPANVTLARDGVEATDYLHEVQAGRAWRPDIVILDLNLPRKNGREVLADIKASPELKQIPVLVMTGSRSDDDINQAYSLNANCYIAKPWDLNEYIKVMRAIADFWFRTATLPDAVPHILSSAQALNLQIKPC